MAVGEHKGRYSRLTEGIRNRVIQKSQPILRVGECVYVFFVTGRGGYDPTLSRESAQ
jgi:hypothetical protein